MLQKNCTLLESNNWSQHILKADLVVVDLVVGREGVDLVVGREGVDLVAVKEAAGLVVEDSEEESVGEDLVVEDLVADLVVVDSVVEREGVDLEADLVVVDLGAVKEVALVEAEMQSFLRDEHIPPGELLRMLKRDEAAREQADRLIRIVESLLDIGGFSSVCSRLINL